MKYLTRVVSGIVLIATSTLPITTFAQSLDEITVTARKTEENLQDVPLAITAIGSEQIDRLGVKDLNSLAMQDTSVQFDQGFNPSDTRITIRGLSPTRGRPNAAVLVDGIDIGSEAVSNAGGSLLIDPRLMDVERIEIVKGPQSALYGRTAFAGAIQYVTKDPDDTLNGEMFVDVNAEGDKSIRASGSIPITDTMGIRLNGLGWKNDGYYRNIATGDYVGGGEGLGSALTLVWEPKDEMKFKWRTEFSKNEYEPLPQALLSDLNTLYDLGDSGGLDPSVSNLAPQTSNCLPDGFIDNYDCPETSLFKALLDNPSLDPAYEAFGGPGVGIWDPTDPEGGNVFNKQVVSIFTGRVPDADEVQVALSPDYRRVEDGDEASAKDFKGNELTLFRSTLVFDWQIDDDLVFTSYTGFTDASDDSEIDTGKWFDDDCRTTAGPGEDPRAAPLDCGPGLGDGINDNQGMFVQDSITYFQQISQEFRIAKDINDDIFFTTGLNYWYERVREDQYNLTLFSGGPVCWLFLPNGDPNEFVDASLNDVSANFLGLNPTQHLCGNSSAPTAYWANDVFEARIQQPSQLRRDTHHYSWYGRLEWDFTDRLKSTLEWRYSRETNSVAGPQQAKCLDINDAFLNDDGAVECNGPEAAAQVGPSAVIVCGQVGRCETIGEAPAFGNSPAGNGWWDYGLFPQQGVISQLKRKDKWWTPKFTMEYAFTDEINGYWSWSRGIKPGGFALLSIGGFGFDPNNDGDFEEITFEPERLDVWEIGFKSDLFDNSLRFNGAFYFQDFKDKQVSVQEVVGLNVGTRTRNIDGSEAWGAEFDATWQATDNLRVQAGYTYSSTRFTDYTVLSRSANDIARTQIGNGKGCIAISEFADGSPGCVLSYNGNDLERSPRNAISLNLNYTNNLFDTGKEWFAEANARYQSSRWLEQYNITEFPAYTRLNVSGGILADNWDLQLYINNVFDDETPIAGGANPGLVTGSFGFGFLGGVFPPGVNAGPKLPSDVYINMPDPRIIGARLTYRFGE